MLQVLLVDLDLGECTPPPDSSTDDAFLLPYAPKLLSALEVRACTCSCPKCIWVGMHARGLA